MDQYREPIPAGKYVQTVREFREDCIKGRLKDDDGYGHFVRDDLMNPDVKVYPSTTSYPKSATHIVWFNK